MNMNSSSSAQGNAESLTRSRLFEIAVPELYEQNAFRVLGLGVDASLRDVRRKQKKLERTGRLGINSNHHGGFLPLKTTPGEDETRRATQRVQDPVARFLDEFFWFWPREAGAKDDDALSLLGRKKVQDAHKLWLRYEGGSSNDKVSTHNLAVLYHVSALDFEQRLLKEDLTEEEHKTRVGCWQRAYGRWRVLLSDTGFWNRVRKRILELDDPQLSPQTVDEVRDCLGKAVLLIQARIAVRAAEQGNAGLAQQHVAIMRNSGLEPRLVEEAIRESARNVRQRIKMLCDVAEPKADADPPHANVVTWNLLRETQPLLVTVDAVLRADDAMRLGAHDEVAGKALSCQIPYGNKTEDWQGSLKMLEAMLKFAGTEAMEGKLNRNIEIVKRNIELGTCYFCGLRQAHDDAAVKVPMHGNVRRTLVGREYTSNGIRTRYQVTWQHATPHVPRCRECKANHAMIVKWAAGVAVSGAVLGALGFFAVWWIGVGGMLVLAIVGGLIGESVGKGKVPYKIKGETDYEQFPRIKELRAEGWKNGEKPSDQEQNSAPIE